MNIDTHLVVIQAYFSGERREMHVILGGCALALALAMALYLIAKDAFSTGFGVLMLAAALMLTWTSLSLFRRDSVREAQLISSLGSAQAQQAARAEVARVDGVVANYKYYRYAAISIGIMALHGVAFTRNSTVHGVVAGLLLLASA